jgi:hypothetical protein
LNGDFGIEASRTSDFFWDIPLVKTRTDGVISNAANSISFGLVLQPKSGVRWFAQHATIDYSKGSVSEISAQFEDLNVSAQYLNPVEILPGKWFYTLQRRTLSFGSGTVVVFETSISNIYANQGLAESLFEIPAE